MATIKNETNYIFSHLVLKDSFFKDKKEFFSILFKDDEEKVIKVVKNIWNHSYEVANHVDGIIKQEITPTIKRGDIDNNLSYFALELPEPQYITDCKYIGILYNQETEENRYFTFEKSYSFNGDGIFKVLLNKLVGKEKEITPSYILGGWELEKHLNFGEINDTGLEGFVEFLKIQKI
ncbi:MAG: hypothetical protein ACRC5G_01890 [Cetobacterium sp.]